MAAAAVLYAVAERLAPGLAGSAFDIPVSVLQHFLESGTAPNALPYEGLTEKVTGAIGPSALLLGTVVLILSGALAALGVIAWSAFVRFLVISMTLISSVMIMTSVFGVGSPGDVQNQRSVFLAELKSGELRTAAARFSTDTSPAADYLRAQFAIAQPGKFDRAVVKRVGELLVRPPAGGLPFTPTPEGRYTVERGAFGAPISAAAKEHGNGVESQTVLLRATAYVAGGLGLTLGFVAAGFLAVGLLIGRRVRRVDATLGRSSKERVISVEDTPDITFQDNGLSLTPKERAE